ncbi:hypothetical protein [Amnibacterium kyonggiense]|uniref:Phospholipase D-like protein n=1 Tax=Amnibacterium kyonggiense TaxID=595671 RepID=A0A4R7FRB6_9MICO|nr:hypothetical protein [Amnibacterium kyonggiense]TDS80350.1 phospholipase D-like protein [Amnibacterium kyonggiense]
MLPMLTSTADESLLLPTGLDVAWWAFAVAVAATSLAALIRVARSSELTALARVFWTVLILLTPPLGPIAALVVVRSRRSTLHNRQVAS